MNYELKISASNLLKDDIYIILKKNNINEFQEKIELLNFNDIQIIEIFKDLDYTTIEKVIRGILYLTIAKKILNLKVTINIKKNKRANKNECSIKIK